MESTQHRVPTNAFHAARDRLVHRRGKAIGAVGLEQTIYAPRAHPDHARRARDAAALLQRKNEQPLGILGPPVAPLPLPRDGSEVDQLVGDVDKPGDRWLGPWWEWGKFGTFVHCASKRKGGEAVISCRSL